MSVWDLTSRAAFEDDAATLYEKTTVNSHRLTHLPQSLSQPISHPRLSVTSLPPDIETQLANNFAFLAAWESTPSCVSAATIARIDESGGIRVSIAANEGIQEPVERSFRSIHVYSKNYAGISKVTCARSLLDIITRLHRNRIFERLGSPKARRFKPGQWPIRQGIVVCVRLGNWIQDLEHRARRQQSTEVVAILLNQVRALHHAIKLAEQTVGDQEHDALQTLIRAAFDITTEVQGYSLQARLGQIGFDDEFTRRKEFREIHAIASYERISIYIAKVARKYHQLFSSMTLRVVQSHKVEVWHGRKHFVHAEIQLLVQHELEPESFSARYIGTSKQACLLCYYFIRAHGVYTVPRTHREIMPQWTVPESQKLTTHGRKCLQKALMATASDVKSSLKMTSSTKRGKAIIVPPCAAHSTRDLSFAPIMTPSAITIDNAQEDDGPEMIADDESPETGQKKVIQPFSASASASASRLDAALTRPTTLQEMADSGTNMHESAVNDLIVSAGYPEIYVSDRLLLFLEVETDHDTNNGPSEISSLDHPAVYKSATCSIRPLCSEDQCIPIIDVDKIGYLGETTIQRGAESEVLQFAFLGDSGQTVVATIRWLNENTDVTSNEETYN
nr:hypothetical protein CFP56_12919 [Quercus suber]